MGDNLDLPLIYTGRYFGFALFSCKCTPQMRRAVKSPKIGQYSGNT